MLDLALVVYRDVGGRGSHLDHRHPDLELVLGQHGARARERLQHQILHSVPGPVDRLADVRRRGHLAGDEEDLGLEPDAGHAQRVLDARLVIDPVLLGDRVQHLSVGR